MSRLVREPDGSISAKKVGTWIVGAAAVVAGLGTLGTHVGGWMKSGLGVNALEARVAACEMTLAEHEEKLSPNPPPPDPNARLDEALPRLQTALQDSQKERLELLQATTRLATIHEYNLDSRRARTVAREVQQTVRVRADAVATMTARPVRPDPVAGLGDI
jgi:hypothetical protein